MNKLDIYIGYDTAQDISSNYPNIVNPPYQVTKRSIIDNHQNTDVNISIHAIKMNDQVQAGRYWRSPDAKASSEFTYTRFLVPHLNKYKGIAIFCDSDFLWNCDITDMLQYYDPRFSVMCVKHDYIPKHTNKMDGKSQYIYPRKNWTSMMIFNCDHNDCSNLTLQNVNTMPPRWLHRMEWTNDNNIGSVPKEYNWLEGEYEVINNPKAIHFTNGGPWHKTWTGDYSEQWDDVARRCVI